MIWSLYVVGVEDDLAEVDICDENLHAKCGVPPVEALIDYSSVDVEFDGVFGAAWGEGSTDPETGDEEDDVVGVERLLKLGVGQSCSLLGIIDVVLIVSEIALLCGDVDLNRARITMSPEE